MFAACFLSVKLRSVRKLFFSGGVDSKELKASMREHADIITATPGKLAELVDSGKLNLSSVRLLVSVTNCTALDMCIRYQQA